MQGSDVTQPVKFLVNETPLLVIHTYILYCYLPNGAFQEQWLLKSIILFILTNQNTQLNTNYNASQLLITMFLNLTKEYLQNYLKAVS